MFSKNGGAYIAFRNNGIITLVSGSETEDSSIVINKNTLNVRGKIQPFDYYPPTTFSNLIQLQYLTLNTSQNVESDKASTTKWYSAKAIYDWATTKLGLKQDTLVSGTNIKTINGTSILGSGNIAVAAGSDPLKVDKVEGKSLISDTEIARLLTLIGDTQILVSTSQNVQPGWNKKTIIFDTNCTITVPATLVEQYEFNFIIKKGVTVTWAKTDPFVWYLENPPTAMTGSTFQTKGYFLRELATNNIHLEF